MDFGDDVDDVEGQQSVKLIQMLGFCQGKDDLEHNHRLADKFFKELQQIENVGSYFVESINKHFVFEIIYVMDLKAQWCICGNGGASYNVRYVIIVPADLRQNTFLHIQNVLTVSGIIHLTK